MELPYNLSGAALGFHGTTGRSCSQILAEDTRARVGLIQLVGRINVDFSTIWKLVSGSNTNIYDLFCGPDILDHKDRFDPSSTMADGVRVAVMWEEESLLRNRARLNDRLTMWPDSKSVGIASTKSCSLNVKCLELLARWWCDKNPEGPCAIPISVLRDEARCSQKKVWKSFSL